MLGAAFFFWDGWNLPRFGLTEYSRMKKPYFIFLCLLLAFAANSCGSRKDESNLGPEEYAYIRSLGILGENEEIELFESNGGLKGWKQSGNFITKERIASYWIEGEEKQVESALFASEVDTMIFSDIASPLHASFLIVKKRDGREFKVYVDADSLRTKAFVDGAIRNWRR